MKYKKEFTIGLLAILAVVLLIYGIDYLKGINVFRPANYYLVSYTNVKGLNKSAPVTLNGYKVGVVSTLEYEYDNPGHILVELSLDKNLKIPEGSKALIESDVLGTATIVLNLSHSTDYLKVGSKLEGETITGMMDNLSTNILPNVEPIISGIDSLLKNLNTLTGDPALIASVKRLDQITAQLSSTLAQLNQATKALPEVMQNVTQTSSNLNEMSGSLADFSKEINELPIDSTMQNIAAISANLNKLSEQLNSPNSTLGMMIHDPALYNNLNQTVSSLDSLFVDIKKNPKRYISIKLL